MKVLKTPFHDKEGNLKFPYQLLRDLVFVWPTPPPEKIGSEKLLFVPKQFERNHQDKTGIVLAVGPGYHSRDGKFHSTPPELKPGVKVAFDNTVPWGYYFTGLDEREHFVFLCGIRDIFGVVE